MEILEAIYTRRSIRKFAMGDVSDDTLQKILRAGMSAPNSGGQRLWQFLVVRNQGQMEKVIDAYPYAKMLRDVPIAIIVCFDQSREKYEERWQMDCATASLNILLAAHGLGLGGVWLEIYPIAERVDAIRESFGMPEHVVPFAVFGIGHPAEEKPALDRYEESLVHYDYW
ncbi:MAG: nitroreductase family protein [Candidatus Thorarchaeota archaeon]|nr:nitroreductase family protein [Candidatus Thorarchaeota archaeon]